MTTSEVASRLDQVLKPAGFKRRGLGWNRPVADLLDAVTVQRSSADDLVCINLGVLDPYVYSTCFGRSPAPFVDEADCTVRTRLGQVVGGRDRWWDLADRSGLDDIFRLLRVEGLPFLERMHSRDEMERHLETNTPAKHAAPPDVVYLAILKAVRGDSSGACSALDRFWRRTFGPWKEDVEKLMAEYGCEGHV